MLEGFTITGGTSVNGGGIYVDHAAPMIRGNEVANNIACSGAGIYSYFGAPVIEDNVIHNNYDGGCTGNDGGGIHIGGTTIPAAVLSGNRIFDNESYFGGGIGVTTAEGTIIRDNEISGNVARSSGGGVYLGGNFDRVFVVQNLIFGNTAGRGGGIHWARGNPQVLQNTISDNDSSFGSAVFAEQQNYETRIVNNVIIVNPGQVAFFCNGFTGDGRFFHNDVFAPGGGSAYGVFCTDQTGIAGNISTDPGFEDSTGSNYDLGASSPLVDAGAASTADLPDVDIAQRLRVVDGNGDQAAIVDTGAYERQP